MTNPTLPNVDNVSAQLRKRHRAEWRFRAYGMIAAGIAVAMLCILFSSIIGKGYGAFWQTYVTLPINLRVEEFPAPSQRTPDALQMVNYQGIVKRTLCGLFPDVTERHDQRALYKLISTGAAYKLRQTVLKRPELIGQHIALSVPMSANLDLLAKGDVDLSVPENERRVKDNQVAWFHALQHKGLVKTRFNTAFFTHADSREPELAGIGGAVVGSLFMLAVTLALSVPIGIAAAIYLEEFAPNSRWTDLMEININNLAAVPSIVFGLLGLAVLLQFMGLPRSAPLVGGLVLSLMTLPTIIISARAALQAVPSSIRTAALSLGASHLQAVFHHVLPLAMPGILTGAVIGFAQAMGETAPLLMIGMVAFVSDIPTTPADPATALPMQIYLWADSAERAFTERTSAAILVLLAFLIAMNVSAIIVRKKFEKRW